MPHINGITPMFLDTVNGRIMLFPNWDMKIGAAFHQLRTDGAFLVSARLKDGVIGELTIKSEKGLPCRIQNPWPGQRVRVMVGNEEVKLEAVAAPAGVKPVNGKLPEIVEFATKAGATYVVSRKES